LGEGIDTVRVGCTVAGDGVVGCHSGVDLWVIGADVCPGAGDLVCHLVVVLSAIKADDCPEAGDLVCHEAVDLWTIGADGCPENGDLVCHWGVDFWFIKADNMSSLGGVLAGAMLSAFGLWLRGMLLSVVHSIPSNLKVFGRGHRWR
jgi:hypothetical protein